MKGKLEGLPTHGMVIARGACMSRTVGFARINRRRRDQVTLDFAEFSVDIQQLANSHMTEARDDAGGAAAVRTWFAADMRIEASGDHLVGTLGFSEPQRQVEFDPEAWSWVKGATWQTDVGSEHTVVPFAVDVRDEQRWVAFGTSPRLQPAGSARGLSMVLNAAIDRLNLLSGVWDVDVVTSRASIEQWVQDHPEVFHMTRTVKLSNPGRDLSDDRREMQALGARRKTEEFAAYPGRTLTTEGDAFAALLDGTETGYLELVLRARGGSGEIRFRSNDRADKMDVPDWGDDLEAGMATVLDALVDYVARREVRGARDRGLLA